MKMPDTFMDNFDPDRSNREKRKLRKFCNNQPRRHKQLYDETGTHIASGKNVCDCLDESCPGCFFPCPRCRSCKCGHECRNTRKWTYDYNEVEGLEIKKINKLKEQSA